MISQIAMQVVVIVAGMGIVMLAVFGPIWARQWKVERGCRSIEEVVREVRESGPTEVAEDTLKGKKRRFEERDESGIFEMTRHEFLAWMGFNEMSTDVELVDIEHRVGDPEVRVVMKVYYTKPSIFGMHKVQDSGTYTERISLGELEDEFYGPIKLVKMVRGGIYLVTTEHFEGPRHEFDDCVMYRTVDRKWDEDRQRFIYETNMERRWKGDMPNEEPELGS